MIGKRVILHSLSQSGTKESHHSADDTWRNVCSKSIQLNYLTLKQRLYKDYEIADLTRGGVLKISYIDVDFY